MRKSISEAVRLFESEDSIKNNGYVYNRIDVKDAMKKPNAKGLGYAISKLEDNTYKVYWIDDESQLSNVRNKGNFLWVIERNKNESLLEAKTGEDGTIFIDKFENINGKWYAPSDELHTNDGWKAIEVPSKILGQSSKFISPKKIVSVRHNVSGNSFTIEIKAKDFDIMGRDLERLQDILKINRIWSSDGKTILVSLQEK